MTEKQGAILLGGGVIAFFLLRSRSLSAATPSTTGIKKPSILSTLFPSLGPNSTGLRTTNMATSGGLAGAPRVPSSGLGFTRTPGVGAGPSSIQSGIGGAIAYTPNALAAIFGKLITNRPPTNQQGGSGKSSSPSSGGYGGSGGTVSPGKPSAGGSTGVTNLIDPSTGLPMGVVPGTSITDVINSPGTYDPITGEWHPVPDIPDQVFPTAPLDAGTLPGAVVDPITQQPVNVLDSSGTVGVSVLPTAVTPQGITSDENGNPTPDPAAVQVDTTPTVVDPTLVASIASLEAPNPVSPTDPFIVDTALAGPGAGGGDDTFLSGGGADPTAVDTGF